MTGKIIAFLILITVWVTGSVVAGILWGGEVFMLSLTLCVFGSILGGMVIDLLGD